jgi:hypothetical protein
MKLFQTPAAADKRRKTLHTHEAARDTAMTRVGGTPKPSRIYMTGERYVHDVKVLLELKKKKILAAPQVRSSAFRPSLLGRDKTCCELYMFNCTNSLSDASFCCGGKPKPVLQVHIFKCCFPL